MLMPYYGGIYNCSREGNYSSWYYGSFYDLATLKIV